MTSLNYLGWRYKIELAVSAGKHSGFAKMSDNSLVRAAGRLFSFSGCNMVKGHRESFSNCKRPMKSCIPTVIEKLRKHPDYQDACDNRLREEAEYLVNPDRIMDHFFSSFTHDMVHAKLVEKEEDNKSELVTSRDSQRSQSRVEEAANFQVKLLLRYVDNDTSPPMVIGKVATALQMEYGPLHALLLINNELLLEWNSSSLIVPQYPDPNHTYEAVTGPVLVSATVQDHLQIQRHLSQPYEDYDEFELIFEATSKKMQLFHNLASVIAKYNSMYYYHAIFRNCQNFVLDALTAIGCKNKPEFGGKLKTYFTYLKTKGCVMVDFKTHEELDDYVRQNVDNLSPENMEYLLTQYFVFHMNSRSQLGLSCNHTDCMMELLEAKIDHKQLIMNRYINRDATS